MKLSDRLRSFDPRGKLSDSPRYFSDLAVTFPSEEMRKAVLVHADEMLGEALPTLPATLYADFVRNGNRSAYETLFFRRRALLQNYAMGLYFTGDREKYFDSLLNVLWAILEETTWIMPAHQAIWTDKLPRFDDAETHNLDLNSAGTGGLLAMLLNWCRKDLEDFSVVLVPRIERMLRERILRPLMEENWMFWLKGGNNWTPWIISNVFTVLVALPLTTEEREAVVARCLPMLANFADTYHEDGGCDEGPTYWSKAGASLFDCCELLYDLTDGKLDLFDDPQLRKMGEYIAKAWISGDYYLNFADAGGVCRPDGTLVTRFGHRVNSPMLESFGRSVIRKGGLQVAADFRTFGFCAYRDAKNMLTFAPSEEEPGSPGNVWLDGLQVMTARQFPDQPDKGLFFACKGGHNAENHNHNDVGSFIVYQDGEPLLPDLGVGTYTKFTFDPATRYTIFSMQSAYHSLPEVDGHQQKPGPQYRAETLWQKDGMLSLDITSAFPEEAEAERWVRTMGLENGVIRVEDDFRLKREKPVRWILISFEKPEIAGNRFRFGKAEILFEEGLTPAVEEHVFEDSRFVNVWKKDRFYRLVLSAEALREGVFTLTIRAISR